MLCQSRQELLLHNARESEGLEQKSIQAASADAEKLGKVVNNEGGKNCSFLFKEILILYFNDSTILLSLIPEHFTLSPQ